MEPHSSDDVNLKEETAQVWSESAEQEQNAAQVHFVPEGGTVAQIVYSDDQDRPSQQVVYTADGTSYTSVDSSEHTLVYIHPVEATQACVISQHYFCLLMAAKRINFIQDQGQLPTKPYIEKDAEMPGWGIGTLFTDPSQVAYVQQDAATQQ
ncbi:PR domain zinc finger protein 10, partial [Varanus komodoensis]